LKDTVLESRPGAGLRFSDGWLVQPLVQARVLTSAQADEAQEESEPSIWAAAVRRQWATDDAIIRVIATAFHVKIAELELADPRTVTLVPESVARKHNVVAISADEKRIRLATPDPRDLNAEQALRFMTGRDVEFLVAAPDAVARKLDELYRPERSIERLLSRLEPAKVETVDETPTIELKDPALEAPVARLVDAMISDGVREGASDIHAEPEEGATVVRYRVDGVLREVMRLPSSAGAALVRRAKILARLDVTDPLHPHDGRAAMRVDGQAIDLRVSTIPIARRGEKVVIRILDQTNLRANLGDLGLAQGEYAILERLLGFREGMLLVTGPTGSGKTTTLYAAINQLKTGRVNIVTVEDPVEYDLGGISQIQVNESQGLTFASALRSVLRQDPDIVLVGEIRDLETAQTAIQAGLSGHFVLSTLHTNDAPSAVVRLRDLGIDGFKIASVLKGIVAQRLVRKICPACAIDVPVESLPVNARPPASWEGTVRIRKATGCKACGGTGYKGRIAVLEVMPVEETVSRLIDAGQPPEVLATAARKVGMNSLWESGLDRAWQGLTTIEELVRVLGERVQEDGTTVPNRASVMLIPDEIRAAIVAADAGPSMGQGSAGASSLGDPVAGTPAGAAAPEKKPAVLIADDDQQMRRLIRAVLEREGFQVDEASDGLDALDLMGRQHFDLLILDMDMPRLDGLGVLEELRASVATATLPVIVLTARTDDTESKALDLGAQDYMTKPVRPTALSARVRAVLRRARA
jgi:type II secretory ATPase GspE/PulE/Tfp pilus assembly ATPase PilB-like protein/CheY-like chemotaxis protein